MSVIRFFTDEDIYGVIAPALRKAGYDAVSTPEAGRIGETDDSQLTYAAGENRVLVTFNVGHFVGVHADWIAQERRHAGIVVSQQRPIGDLLRRLTRLASHIGGEAMQDRLEFLSDW